VYYLSGTAWQIDPLRLSRAIAGRELLQRARPRADGAALATDPGLPRPPGGVSR